MRSCARVNSGLKPSVCDRHEGLFWLSFMAGCHPKSNSKSSFLIKLHTKKQHFLFPHARVGVHQFRRAEALVLAEEERERRICKKNPKELETFNVHVPGPKRGTGNGGNGGNGGKQRLQQV